MRFAPPLMPSRRRPLLVAAVLVVAALAPAFAADYIPPPHQWERRAPAQAGFDAQRLAAAVAHAQENAVVAPADLRVVLDESWGKREPGYRILGPVVPRAQASGMIVRGGYIVAEWGDLQRPDMTFSTVKSYLSTVAGLALADGDIAALDEPVARSVPGEMFEGPHNSAITWTHLLHQTSDWSGALWEVADWADRPEGDDPANRPLRTPGTHYKYNDVRINLLAYSLLQVVREPLPQLLKRRVMDPIGASPTWRWHGYENSWVDLDGLRMQSVAGGGHFGGGMVISTLDHARFGLLVERDGLWGTQRLIPAGWIDRATRPSPVKADYGYLWWLNTGREAIPAAPESAFWAAGFGGNYVYIDREHDLVIVLRWTPDLDGVVTRTLAALEEG